MTTVPIHVINYNLDTLYNEMLSAYDIGTCFYMKSRLRQLYLSRFDPVSDYRLKRAITYFLRYKEYIPSDCPDDECEYGGYE